MTTIWPLVKAAPAWLIMSVVFGALAEMLVVDLVPLGPLFLPAVAATSAAILVATLGATFFAPSQNSHCVPSAH